MAAQAEVARLVARLVGNSNSFNKMMVFAESQTKRFEQVWSSNMGKLEKTLQTVSLLGRSFGAALAPLAGIFGGIGIASGRAFTAFESSFAEARKTLEGTEEQFGRLKQEMKDLSLQVPLTPSQLNQIAGLGGQMGIAIDNVSGFSKVIADFTTSTNVSVQDAALQLARLGKITKTPEDQFNRLSSAIVDLGNNFPTLESEILQLSLRLASTGTVVGLTADEILGFSAAISSVGILPEAGGTAFDRVMLNIQSAVSRAGDELRQLESITDQFNTTGRTFAQLFREDASEAILLFIESLGKLHGEGVNVLRILEDMGITQVRVRRVILAAAVANGTFREAVERSAIAAEHGNKAAEEASKRYQSLASRITLAANAFRSLGESIFEVVADNLKTWLDTIADKVRDAERAWKGLNETTKEFIAVFSGFVILSPAVFFGLGSLAFVLNQFINLAGPLLSVLTALPGAITSVVRGLVAMEAALTVVGRWAQLQVILVTLPAIIKNLLLYWVALIQTGGVGLAAVFPLAKLALIAAALGLLVKKLMDLWFWKRELETQNRIAVEIEAKQVVAQQKSFQNAIRNAKALKSWFDRQKELNSILKIAKKDLDGYNDRILKLKGLLSGAGQTARAERDAREAELESLKKRAEGMQKVIDLIEKGLGEEKPKGAVPGMPDDVGTRIQEITEKYREMIKVLGETERQTALRNIAEDPIFKDFPEEVAKLKKIINEAFDAEKAHNLKASIDELTESFIKQAETVGMTADEIRLWELANEGATDAQLKAARAALEQAKAAKRHNDMIEEGKRLAEEFADPMKKLVERQRQLREMFDAGAIDAAVFAAAMKAVREEFDEEFKVKFGTEGLDSTIQASTRGVQSLIEQRDLLNRVRQQGQAAGQVPPAPGGAAPGANRIPPHPGRKFVLPPAQGQQAQANNLEQALTAFKGLENFIAKFANAQTKEGLENVIHVLKFAEGDIGRLKGGFDEVRDLLNAIPEDVQGDAINEADQDLRDAIFEAIFAAEKRLEKLDTALAQRGELRGALGAGPGETDAELVDRLTGEFKDQLDDTPDTLPEIKATNAILKQILERLQQPQGDTIVFEQVDLF